MHVAPHIHTYTRTRKHMCVYARVRVRVRVHVESQLVGCWALTEPSNGSDASALTATATKVPGEI